MKLVFVLLGLSVAVMAVMIFQAARQEVDLMNMRTHMVSSAAEVAREERSIVGLKTNIDQMKKTLVTLNTNIQELRKKKIAAEKSTVELSKSLQTCKTEKEAVEKKKTETGEAITNLSAGHNEAKHKAEEEIQKLKQQILDRDKAICVYADTTKEEARKLCGLPETPK